MTFSYKELTRRLRDSKFQWNGNFDFLISCRHKVKRNSPPSLNPASSRKGLFYFALRKSIFYVIQWYIWWHVQRKIRKYKLSIISRDSIPLKLRNYKACIVPLILKKTFLFNFLIAVSFALQRLATQINDVL